MNVQEFIKQYGWGKSSVIVFESIGYGANTFYDTCDELYYGQINDIRVSVAELKQYIDAWDLVESLDGLSSAKITLQRGEFGDFEMLKQAIELVESVNENQD